MPLNRPISELIEELSRVGRRPPEHLVRQILATPDEARAPLVALATRKEALHAAEPACWGPVHALRLLGEIPDTSMVEPLLNTLPVEIRYEGDQAAEFWAAEVLEIIASCGTDIIPLLWEWSEGTTHSDNSRGAALHTLIYIGHNQPETYDDIAAEARARLAQSQDTTVTTFLVYLLSGLEVEAAYKEVMAAYREKRVDTEVLPAATARQLIFGRQMDKERLKPIPFWERYELDGPFAA